MRIATVVIGVVVFLFGSLWALQGFGVVGGSPMTNTTTWSIIGPIVALIGLGLAVAALETVQRGGYGAAIAGAAALLNPGGVW